MRLSLFLTCLTLPISALAAEVPPLLAAVAEKMADERQNWAFTQLARETAGNGAVLERLERYDPSRGDAHRWQLLKLNGRAATAQEAEAWGKRKNRTKGRAPKTLEDYADLSLARVKEQDARTVTYEVPLRSAVGGLFPGNKINLTLIVDRKTKEIERAQAGIDGPFNVALGLAKVIALDLNIEVPDEASHSPEKTQGTATAVVNRFGKRVEYQWSDFKKVTSSSAAH